MPKLREKQRESMHKEVFAYVDKRGEGHLPLNDETHIRNAMARWNQTGFPSASAKEAARRKIVSAAKQHGIEVSPEDKIARRSTSLRAAHTKRGPRGGKSVVRRTRPTTTAQRKAARRNIKKAVATRRRRR